MSKEAERTRKTKAQIFEEEAEERFNYLFFKSGLTQEEEAWMVEMLQNKIWEAAYLIYNDKFGRRREPSKEHWEEFKKAMALDYSFSQKMGY